MDNMNNQECVPDHTISWVTLLDLNTYPTSRFDGRIIRVDKASERSNPRNGGFQGRGGYNRPDRPEGQTYRGGGAGGMLPPSMVSFSTWLSLTHSLQAGVTNDGAEHCRFAP